MVKVLKPAPEKVEVTVFSVKDAVAEKVGAAGPVVFELVAQKLAQEEVDKRVALVLQHYTEVDNIDKEVKKLKPDLWNGTEYGGYTKDTYDKRAKLSVRKAKVEDAIYSALTNNDFGPLKNLGDNKDVPKA